MDGILAGIHLRMRDRDAVCFLEATRSAALARARTTVTARKDDAPAADQAAMANVAGLMAFSGGGGLIQTTPG